MFGASSDFKKLRRTSKARKKSRSARSSGRRDARFSCASNSRSSAASVTFAKSSNAHSEQFRVRKQEGSLGKDRSLPLRLTSRVRSEDAPRRLGNFSRTRDESVPGPSTPAGAARSAHVDTTSVSSAAHRPIHGGKVVMFLQLRIESVLSFGRRVRSGTAHETSAVSPSVSRVFVGATEKELPSRMSVSRCAQSVPSAGGSDTSRASVRSIFATRRNVAKNPGRNATYRRSTPAFRVAVSFNTRRARSVPRAGTEASRSQATVNANPSSCFCVAAIRDGRRDVSDGPGMSQNTEPMSMSRVRSCLRVSRVAASSDTREASRSAVAKRERSTTASGFQVCATLAARRYSRTASPPRFTMDGGGSRHSGFSSHSSRFSLGRVHVQPPSRLSRLRDATSVARRRHRASDGGSFFIRLLEQSSDSRLTKRPSADGRLVNALWLTSSARSRSGWNARHKPGGTRRRFWYAQTTSVAWAP